MVLCKFPNKIPQDESRVLVSRQTVRTVQQQHVLYGVAGHGPDAHNPC